MFAPGSQDLQRFFNNAEHLLTTRLSSHIEILSIVHEDEMPVLQTRLISSEQIVRKHLIKHLSTNGFCWRLEVDGDFATLRIKPHYGLLPLKIPRINLVLFFLTCISVTSVGFLFSQTGTEKTDTNTIVSYILEWLPFSLSIIFILLVHEMGHFIVARRRGLLVSWPYFIPFPSIFGTLGAVIKTSSPIPDRKALFDIGASGPLAGFIASTIVICGGLIFYSPVTLPGANSDSDVLVFGSSILFSFWEKLFRGDAAASDRLLFNPLLYAGWVGYFLTMFNLLPVGQLDGGHIAYAMFCRYQKILALVIFILISSMGIVSFLETSGLLSSVGLSSVTPYFWPGWLFFSLFLFFVVKISHPPTADDTIQIDKGRMVIGWILFAVFVLTFVPNPVYILAGVPR